MTNRMYQEYLKKVAGLIEQAIDQSQQAGSPIDAASELIAEAISSGRVLYVFGASHAGLMAQDLFYRAGGLIAVEPILPAGLMLNVKPITKTSALEREKGFAKIILQDVPLGEQDVLLLISVSGRNAVIVEMAQEAVRRGTRVIALTNLNYSKSVAPRSGDKRLFEVADVVIDLPGVLGDAIINLDGLEQPVGPTSTTVGDAILQGLMVEVCERLLKKGFQPPVLVSANLDGGDERNRYLFETYRSKVSYL